MPSAENDAGRCGTEAPRLVNGPRVWCCLRAGHVGWHRGDDDSEWGQPDAGNDVPQLTALLSAHHLEVEPRAYPSYACSCESWDGAEGDDGGESDGLRDNETGWATHVAERLVAAGYTRVIPPAKTEADQ